MHIAILSCRLSVRRYFKCCRTGKRDIFYESTQNTANWRAFIEKRENNRIEAVYNYVSCNGQYAFTKVRLQGKHIIYGRLENERFTYGLSRNKPRKSYRAVYGNLSDIKRRLMIISLYLLSRAKRCKYAN